MAPQCSRVGIWYVYCTMRITSVNTSIACAPTEARHSAGQITLRSEGCYRLVIGVQPAMREHGALRKTPWPRSNGKGAQLG